MMLKKKNHLFKEMVNRREACFWNDIINEFSYYVVDYPEEKLKRLTKIIHQYKYLCDMCEKICSIIQNVKSIKSYMVSK